MSETDARALEDRLSAKIDRLFARVNAGGNRRVERRLAEVEEALNTQKFLLWKLETMAHKEIEALRAVEAKVDCTIRRVEDVVDVDAMRS